MQPPVFVGGTGRSGTTITGKLIGAHARFHMIPIEIRLITDDDGLLDLIEGKTTFPRFARGMERRWWRRDAPNGQPRGIHRFVEPETLSAAMARLESGVAVDSAEAARQFVHSILDPAASAAGAGSWVEMTPPNALRAGELLRTFPEARLIHSVRDGRDVAASVATMNWGPNDFDEALEWWSDRMLEAARSADDSVRDRVLVLTLEELTITARDATVARVFDFLGLEPDESTLAFVGRMVRPDRAHVRRWAEGMDSRGQARVTERYRQILDHLTANGAGYLVDRLSHPEAALGG